MFDRRTQKESERKEGRERFLLDAQRKVYIRTEFNEPQWQILEFLTQFYTFKKFQRRLLSSYTIFFPSHYIKGTELVTFEGICV
jgi:hypothetical protein